MHVQVQVQGGANASGVTRSINYTEDAAVSQAPSAPPDLRHVPMVVSTGEQAVRVWSVCADFAAATAMDEKKRVIGAKGVSLSMMRGHEGQVTCCTVTQGGQVVSGSLDCTVRLWRPHGGKCLDVLRSVFLSFSAIFDRKMQKLPLCSCI